jgi:hypothetical protein
MAVLDTFLLLFEADTTKVKAGLKDTEKQAEGLGKNIAGVDANIAKMGDSFLSLATKAAGLIGVGFSLKEIISTIADVAKDYTQLEKLALQFRTTADAVDEFADAGQLLGLSNEQTIGGLKSLDGAIQDTAMGLGRAKKVFDDLHISVKDVHGAIKPTTQVMAELQEKFKTMDRGKQMRVMERLGLDPSLLKLFNSDMGELRIRMEKIDKATHFDFATAIKKSGEFTKASKAMWLEIRTLGMYFDKLKERISVGAMDTYIRAMNFATVVLKKFFNFLVDHQEFAEGFFIAIGAAISYFLIPAAISGAVAIWAMIAPFVIAGAAILAVAGLFALLYDDVMNFIDGNDSMIGQIASKYPIVGEIVRGIVGSFELLWEIAKNLLGFLVDLFLDPLNAMANFDNAMNATIDGLKEKFSGLYDIISDFKQMLTDVGEVAGKVWDTVKGFFGGGDVSVAQNSISTANSTPLNSTNSGAIGSKAVTKNNNVSVGKVEVHTQATDANGISKSIGSTLSAQLKTATANADNGVIA